MTGSLRIGFMGTPDFALETLKALHKAGHDIVCVYSQPPRPKGRGHKVQLSPVHAYAEEQDIPVFTPVNFKSEEDRAIFKNHNLDLAIVAAYGLILPQEILDAPTYGCINIHASLLPRWRGASPIQHAIWKGDNETGVTLMQMERGLDTGPMIMRQASPITNETTASALHDDLAEMGAQMTLKLLSDLKALKNAIPQNDADSTYAPLLSKSDGRIDWSQTAREIDQQIRGLNPWPGVWTELEGKRFKILQARPSGKEIKEPRKGTLVDEEGTISCGQNTALKILTLQPEGKKPMDIHAAMNGGYFKPFMVFE